LIFSVRCVAAHEELLNCPQELLVSILSSDDLQVNVSSKG
jgi:hypothetical protein